MRGATPRRRTSGLIERLSRAVRELTSAESADSRTTELIATVSHEIRSPLTTVKGFTKTLLDRWDRLSDETKQDMLRAINADADRVTRLLTELLDVSRIEAGTLSLHRRPFDLRELAAGVVSELATRSEQHVVAVVPGGPVGAFGDPDKLKQVLTNFIENAMKYTDGGHVSVNCRSEDGWATVEVADEGPGVPDTLRGRLFEKFSRRDVPGSPTGTGLGLYICKGLIEAHDGEIGERPRTPAGSVFWFRIPAGEAP